ARARGVQPLHLAWTERVIEEFYRQGDQERALGLTISPFMDRDKANVAAAQVCPEPNLAAKPMTLFTPRSASWTSCVCPCTRSGQLFSSLPTAWRFCLHQPRSRAHPTSVAVQRSR